MIHVIGQKKLKLLPRQNVQGTCSNFVFFSKHHINFKNDIFSKSLSVSHHRNEVVSVTPCALIGPKIGSYVYLGMSQDF